MAETFLRGKPLIIGFKGSSDRMPLPKRVGKVKSKILVVATPEFSSQLGKQQKMHQEEDSCCKLYKHLDALRQTVSEIILLWIVCF
jgi:hypothetical protein